MQYTVHVLNYLSKIQKILNLNPQGFGEGTVAVYTKINAPMYE